MAPYWNSSQNVILTNKLPFIYGQFVILQMQVHAIAFVLFWPHHLSSALMEKKQLAAGHNTVLWARLLSVS